MAYSGAQQKANFSLINSDSDEEFDKFFHVGPECSNIVSLEEGVGESSKKNILYNNVVAEDISSDEAIDAL